MRLKIIPLISLLLLISLFIGMASAGTPVVPSSAPTYKIGPSMGFRTLGTAQAGDVYATDDLKVGDDAWVLDDMWVNGTLTTGAVTIGPGPATVSGGLAYSVNASTTVNTTLTSASTKTVYGIDASSSDVTVTLPDATTVAGRVYMVASSANAGSNYARVKATAGKFGGSNGVAAATGLKSTDDAGSGITLVSDGSNYLIVGSYGTWASG